MQAVVRAEWNMTFDALRACRVRCGGAGGTRTLTIQLCRLTRYRFATAPRPSKAKGRKGIPSGLSALRLSVLCRERAQHLRAYNAARAGMTWPRQQRARSKRCMGIICTGGWLETQAKLTSPGCAGPARRNDLQRRQAPRARMPSGIPLAIELAAQNAPPSSCLRVYGIANTCMLVEFVSFSSAIRLTEPATSDGPVVTATYCLPLTANAIGIAADRRAEVRLPQHLAGAVVEGAEAAVGVAAEHQPAAGGDQRQHRRRAARTSTASCRSRPRSPRRCRPCRCPAR